MRPPHVSGLLCVLVPTHPHPPSVSGMSQVCLLLALLLLCSCTKVFSTNSLELVKEKWSSYKDQCLDYLNATAPPPGWCVTGPLICTSAGLMDSQEQLSMCPAHGSCHGTAKQQYGRILSQLRIMYTVGYSLSLGALLLALGILITFRKLHCMRNNIHMNLFASFILRAVSILVKDALLALTLDPRSGGDTRTQAWVNIPAVTWCRGAMVMMQYSVMANNYWLLVEGIYLHSLLVITSFSERKCTAHIRVAVDHSEISINFFIFIRIIKILMSKLRAHQMRYTDYKFRLAKSTLTLIPLLGIHAILFTFVIDESVPKGSMLRLIRLFCDLLFNSFQGLLVAILYCFINKETNPSDEVLGVLFNLHHICSFVCPLFSHPAGAVRDAKKVEEVEAGTATPTATRRTSRAAALPLAICPISTTTTPATPAFSYSNGTGKGGTTKSRHTLQFSFLPHRGASSHVSTATEEACLEEKLHTNTVEGEETNV
ncbi:hypothetical protein F7725_016135 [Dissostichus mawsoni]|uniref:G-protein coupled receptors family 2 profile 2 domain-containing protein n=1 Tax=Dissostichus mawsoni TaxID=36200 RepID=A0A7J5Y621_DISMA|nr:hypothetical protein F7725_016135 [Dissostichus mawsoni]